MATPQPLMCKKVDLIPLGGTPKDMPVCVHVQQQDAVCVISAVRVSCPDSVSRYTSLRKASHAGLHGSGVVEIHDGR